MRIINLMDRMHVPHSTICTDRATTVRPYVLMSTDAAPKIAFAWAVEKSAKAWRLVSQSGPLFRAIGVGANPGPGPASVPLRATTAGLVAWSAGSDAGKAASAEMKVDACSTCTLYVNRI
jgi:hypothetical protein